MSLVEVDLAITSMGLLSSVGHDVVTACAALRAGISRPAPIPEHPVVDLIEHEATPLVGHPITPITDGFCSGARWLQMVPLAFDDMLAYGGLGMDPGYWQRTAIVVLLPDLDEPRFEHDERARLELLGPQFEAVIASRLPPGAARVIVRPAGRAGLARVVIEAPELMRGLGVERVAVVAVDSYLDAFSLEWLAESGRLKDDFNPAGLVPGEAAAALMLEPAALCGTSSRAYIRAAGVAGPSSATAGRRLAHLLQSVPASSFALYSDLNGEERKARIYGEALSSLDWSQVEISNSSSIASETGDVGDVFMMCSCVLAARSQEQTLLRETAAVAAVGSDESAEAIVIHCEEG